MRNYQNKENKKIWKQNKISNNKTNRTVAM